jgi:hypothetical protein
MDAQQILGKIKQVFNDLTAPVAAAAPMDVPTEPKEYEIMGGGMVMIDKLEVGGIVMIDGNPALVGVLELADGHKLTIGDNGVISAIEMPLAVDPTLDVVEEGNKMKPLEEEMSAKFTAFETSTNEKFSSYEAKLSAYEQRFAANENQLGAYKTELSKHKEMIEKLLQFGQLMVDAPAAQADPAAKVANTFKAVDTEKIKASTILFN